MNYVPTMISTKDASYLKDMFNWNMVAFKKFESYLECIEDEEIIEKTDSIIDMLLKNCEEIIKIFESEGKNNE